MPALTSARWPITDPTKPACVRCAKSLVKRVWAVGRTVWAVTRLSPNTCFSKISATKIVQLTFPCLIKGSVWSVPRTVKHVLIRSIAAQVATMSYFWIYERSNASKSVPKRSALQIQFSALMQILWSKKGFANCVTTCVQSVTLSTLIYVQNALKVSKWSKRPNSAIQTVPGAQQIFILPLLAIRFASNALWAVPSVFTREIIAPYANLVSSSTTISALNSVQTASRRCKIRQQNRMMFVWEMESSATMAIKWVKLRANVN